MNNHNMTLIDLLKKHSIFMFFVYLILLVFLSSRYTQLVIYIPKIINKIITVFLYIPFFILLIKKIKNELLLKRTSHINLFFYIFCIYYICISIYRLFNKMEVKNNLYYTVILLGSIGLEDYIQDKYSLPKCKDLLFTDLSLIVIFILLYYSIYNLFLTNLIIYSPINENIIGIILILIFPILIYMSNNTISKFKRHFLFISIAGCYIVVFTLGSRAIFCLFLAELLFLLFVNHHFKFDNSFIRWPALCSIICVVLLYLCNIGSVQFNVYREVSFLNYNNILHLNVDDKTNDESKSITKNKNLPQSVDSQMNRADNMRNDLMNQSIAQFLENPVFGTGKVLFIYKVGEENYVQSGHNAILETLNCYGIFGTVLIMLYLSYKIKKSKLFGIKEIYKSYNIQLIYVISIMFFVESMVEPIAYDILVLPLYVICISSLIIFNARKA